MRFPTGQACCMLLMAWLVSAPALAQQSPKPLLERLYPDADELMALHQQLDHDLATTQTRSSPTLTQARDAATTKSAQPRLKVRLVAPRKPGPGAPAAAATVDLELLELLRARHAGGASDGAATRTLPRLPATMGTPATTTQAVQAPAATPRPAVGTGEAINVNRADRAQIMKTLLIDSARARNIIEFREFHGDYKKPEDLGDVTGITEAMIRYWIRHDLLRFD